MNAREHIVDAPLRCSFCHKAATEVRKLIAGPTVFICDECVEVCVDIIATDADVKNVPQNPADKPRASALAAFPLKSGICALCGKSIPLQELLPIENRGMLCGSCADAIEDAMAHGRPVS